ncbi:MAG: RHS repeat protein [Chlamydiae bacterium]|nr:RHS repeat protein [Chlamydiota bacterium]
MVLSSIIRKFKVLGFCPLFLFSNTYHFDVDNHLQCIVREDGRRISLKVDAVGHLQEILYPGGQTVSYTYNQAGRVIKMQDQQGTTNYLRDALGRLITVSYPGLQPLTYEYNERNDVTAIRYPGGQAIFYTYQDNGLLQSVHQAGVPPYQAATHIEFFYQPQTARLQRILFNQRLSVEYIYDCAGRITHVIYIEGEAKPYTFHYVYDANHNCVLAEELADTSLVQKTTYAYDSLDRLTQVIYADGSFEKYSYDSFGNRKTKETREGTEIYEYNEHNQLVQRGPVRYFYDILGRLVKKQKGEEETTYRYDDEDHLLEVITPIHKVQFTYSGDGRRVSKTIDDKTTNYVHDALSPLAQVLLEITEEKYIKAFYTYAGMRLLRTLPGVESQFYVYDRPGKNVFGLLNSRGFVRANMMDSFGRVLKSSPDHSNPYQFAGEEVDEETGLVYLRNRYYDPETGRFLTPDQAIGSLKRPDTWNPYIYALNNPVTKVDPLGLAATYEVCVYPPGTIVEGDVSPFGHAIGVIRVDGRVIAQMGKYFSFNPYKREVEPNDPLPMEYMSYSMPIPDDAVPKIREEFGRKGPYLLFANNCVSAVLEMARKYGGDPNFGKEIKGIPNPTSLMEYLAAYLSRKKEL